MPDIAEFTRRLGHYLGPTDVSLVEAAYAFSNEAHEGQYRRSGEPYITHPLAVASILSEWRFDAEGLSAALLHDVMEDTGVGKDELERRFGHSVAEIVDGVSKLDQIEFQTREAAQAESFRKMLLAMAQDVRVILIKLADRLHNMRTLEAMSPEHRRRIARETLEIYAPLANRLGLNRLYQELQDLAFRHLHPMRYRVLAKAIKSAGGNRREIAGKMLDAIRGALDAAGIPAVVMGREKGLYSTYRKMSEKHLSFSQVLDIYGFRVLVDDAPSCYKALGVLHQLYKPIPGKFKDYIAIPKNNGYQSLHTTLFGPYGMPVEVQIRTQAMHGVAEAGVASHWLYKSGSAWDLSEAQRETHKWLQGLLEIQSESNDSAEFLEHVKGDLFPDEIYVFTPKGKIMALPRGATAVDFAYAVHTDVGHHCVAARVNQELTTLRTPLRNGDQVEIITSPSAKPSPSWLNFVVTGKARSRIRHFLRTLQQKESAALGERMLQQALADLGVDMAQVPEARWSEALSHFGVKSRPDLCADIGLGRRLSFVVAQALTGARSRRKGKAGPVMLKGVEGVAVQYAACCYPLPGDDIVGVLKVGQGLLVHVADCPVVKRQAGERDQPIEVAWDREVKGLFEAAIRVFVSDQRGLLARVAGAIAEAGANIATLHIDRPDGGNVVTMAFTIQVTDRDQLAQVMRELRRIPEVRKIQRARADSGPARAPGRLADEPGVVGRMLRAISSRLTFRGSAPARPAGPPATSGKSAPAPGAPPDPAPASGALPAMAPASTASRSSANDAAGSGSDTL